MVADFSLHDERAPFAPFPKTRRSAVAGVRSGEPAERARAFEILVRAYWRPVYKHIRIRWRRPPEDARDLTQAFFAHAFERHFFANYDPQKALFRTFLKGCLDRFVLDANRGERRQKRGAGFVHLSLDFDGADEELAHAAPHSNGNPEACFDTEWTRSLLASTVDALRATCLQRGKAVYFTVFHRYVLDPGPAPASSASAEAPSRPQARPSYAELAAELEISVSDVTNYLSWSRREFRALLLAKLREITASDDEFRSEARALLGRSP